MKNVAIYMTNVLIDSNILVYAYDASSEKHQKALEFLKKSFLDGSAVLSVQNIVEFSRIMTEKIPKIQDHDHIRIIVMELSEALDILYYDSHTVADALNIAKMNKLHFFDSLIAATMEKYGIKVIATENEKDFKKISWITVINPVK